MTAEAQTRLESSARRYPLYLFFQKASYWGPVFFLYFRSLLTLQDVLILEAVYYVSVVVLEIPTGYLADRFGQRRVLVWSSISQAAACAVFVGSSTFWHLATGQVLLALGMALGSGSDTAYHFSVLKELSQEEEYGVREAKAAKVLLISQAASALVGGLIAIVDLRLAYALSFVSATVAAGLSLRFTETDARRSTESVWGKVGGCLIESTHPRLMWLMAFYIYMTVVNHIPYEFYQPVLAGIVDRSQISLPVSATTGIHTAITMAVATLGAALSIPLRDRFGASAALLAAGVLQTGIILSLMWIQSPAIALILALRSVPRGLMQAPLNAEVVPLISETRRSTYLSIQSLLGRLSFGGVLLILSRATVDGDLVEPIQAASWGTATGLFLLILTLPLSHRLGSPTRKLAG